MAHLRLDDTNEALISDAGLALKIQAEDLVNAVQVVEDAQFARVLATHRYDIVNNPTSSIHHREVALSLLQRSGLPDRSDVQPKESSSPVHTVTGASRDLDKLQYSERYVDISFTLYPKLTIHISIPCMACKDFVSDDRTALQAPCEHYYCEDCTINLVNACISDELLYPPKCCNRLIPHDMITPFLDDGLRSLYRSKQREFAVPAALRIYCPTPDCPVFIASSESIRGDVTCYMCKARVCSMCKQAAHVGPCSNDPGILQVRALARIRQWQTCPKCYAVVERTGGCNHMVCSCTSQFCYYCGRSWKTCPC